MNNEDTYYEFQFLNSNGKWSTLWRYSTLKEAIDEKRGYSCQEGIRIVKCEVIE